MLGIGQQRLTVPTIEFSGEAVTTSMVLTFQRAIVTTLIQAICSTSSTSVFAQLYICNLCPLILENQNQKYSF